MTPDDNGARPPRIAIWMTAVPSSVVAVVFFAAMGYLAAGQLGAVVGASITAAVVVLAALVVVPRLERAARRRQSDDRNPWWVITGRHWGPW